MRGGRGSIGGGEEVGRRVVVVGVCCFCIFPFVVLVPLFFCGL